MKIKPIVTIALSTSLISEFSIQLGLTAIRADILPVALNIIGMAFILSNHGTKYKIIFASVFFTLAFSAKITAVHGILSVFIWLILTKRTKEALWILLLTFIGYILFFSVLYFGTSGRIISIFSACSSGGADLFSVLKAPILFIKLIIMHDLICLLLLIWAFIIAYKHINSLMNNLIFIFWFLSFITTIAIFGSPGTDYNHLVDVSTASILLIGSIIYHSKSQSKKLFIYFCSILIVSSIIYNVISLRSLLTDENNHVNKRYPKEIVNIFKSDDVLVLSEDPMLPIMANKKPYILDSFMLRFLKALIRKNILL